MLLWFLLGLLCISSISAQKPSSLASEEESDVYYPYPDWSDTFDWKLLKAVSSMQYRNVLISPISLKLVLALLYEGSSGVTEREFQNVLQFPVHKQLVRENFNSILEALQASERKQYLLNLGSRIFMDSGITPQQNFAAKALHNYQTDIEPTNFSHPLGASHSINSWVDKLTNGRISELVRPGDLDDAIMVIGNALYFKGTWRHQFPKNRTKVGGFYVSPTQVVNVPYMSTTDKFFFFESMDLDAKILRLPYRGGRYSMFIILPNSKGGLPDLIKNVNLQVLKRQLYLMDQIPVEVSIPKFKFSFQTRYSKILQEFGLHQMFQNTASFAGIARGQSHLLRSLVVSDIIQKTGIELDEEGSVVYAASAIQLGNKFGEADNVFNATHPFMFFIEEQTKGTVLFVGKVNNPLEADVLPLPTRFGDDDHLPASAPEIVVHPQPLANTPNLQPQSFSPQNYPQNPGQSAVVRRFHYFDLELLKEFSESPGNVLISPASIKTTLALILEGAKGKCAEEISNALRIDNIQTKEIRELLTRLLFDLTDKSENSILEAANSVFVSDKFRILPEYERRLAEYYKGTARSVDFSNAQTAAKLINAWASNSTHGIINQIVGSQNLPAETTIVLANALYFKGKWKTSFDVKRTKVKCFNSPTRRCVNTPMMEVSDVFNYSLIVDLNAYAIELPYQDDRYSMLVLVPTNSNNARVLARDMLHTQLNEILNQLRPTDIVLEFPKFELDFTADMIPYLKSLKIQEVFGAKANLTGIIPNENIKISNVVHKTAIEVNEEGTKAAAVTGALVIPLMGTTAQRVSVDRPFIFFIYQKESRNIIFEGIFMEPADVGSNYAVPSTQSRIKTGEDQYYNNQQRTVPQYRQQYQYPAQNDQRY